jgi:hypothetical protein
VSLLTSWWNHSPSDQSALQALLSRVSWTCTTEKHRPSITSTIDRAANGSFQAPLSASPMPIGRKSTDYVQLSLTLRP